MHAIGPDVLLAEVQQSSGITYRVWDWNRVDDKGRPRELHVEQAFEVLNFDPDFNLALVTSRRSTDMQKSAPLASHRQFEVELLALAPRESKELAPSHHRPVGLMVLEGEVALAGGGTLGPYRSALLSSPVQASGMNQGAVAMVIR